MKKEEKINSRAKKIFQKLKSITITNKLNIKRLILILIFLLLFLKMLQKKNYKIISISYSDYKYKRQLCVNRISAIKVGKVDEYYSYGPKDIDKNFYEKNKDILSRKRGNGYWLWKPYFILKTFNEKLNEGDYLIYTDAGVLYMNSTQYIIDFMHEQNLDMWMIYMHIKERLFTKRDAFILLGLDEPIYTESYMYMATIQVYKKSNYTKKFLEELLYYSQDKRIITDDNNTQGYDNYPGFIDNRHDQTVLSLLIKKYRIAKEGKNNIYFKKYYETKSFFLPDIFCVFRTEPFKNYNHINKKCITEKKRFNL